MTVMTKNQTVLPSLLCLLLLVSNAVSADGERGRLFYENHCRACHESSVHIREVQSAKSLGALRAQVSHWQDVLKLGWSAEDVGDVAQYLNDTWYHYAN
jgi:mono/diheme cytochrome c family protein